MASDVHVRFCPAGQPTFDEHRTFERIPHIGEAILRGDHGQERFVVVEIDWQLDGSPFVIAHGWDRPRAQKVRHG